MNKTILVFEFSEGCKLELELKRSFLPFTHKLVVEALPINLKGLINKSMIQFPMDFSSKSERLRTEFKRGEVSLTQSSDQLSIHLRESTVENPESLLGILDGDISCLENLASPIFCIINVKS